VDEAGHPGLVEEPRDLGRPQRGGQEGEGEPQVGGREVEDDEEPRRQLRELRRRRPLRVDALGADS